MGILVGIDMRVRLRTEIFNEGIVEREGWWWRRERGE